MVYFYIFLLVPQLPSLFILVAPFQSRILHDTCPIQEPQPAPGEIAGGPWPNSPAPGAYFLDQKAMERDRLEVLPSRSFLTYPYISHQVLKVNIFKKTAFWMGYVSRRVFHLARIMIHLGQNGWIEESEVNLHVFVQFI